MPVLLLHCAALCACLAFAAPAHAAFVDFDDLPWTPAPGGETNWDENPVTDQYAALGLVVRDGYLLQGEGRDQYLLGSSEFSISFTGVLPRYVSFTLSSPSGENEATTVATAGDGSVAGVGSTGGWYWGGPEVGLTYDRLYQANSPISFYSAAGISGLSFATFGSTRFTGVVDKLYFGAVAPVPEPASLVLAAAGLGVLLASRRRRPGG
jgi:hypothetical protein